MSQLRTTVTLHVQPNAKRNEVLGFADDTLRLKIAAPPVKGKANKELIDFLSNLLGIGKGAITIEKGLTSRTKVVAIAGLDRDSIIERLGAAKKG
jgi:uncharacterized protein (TIGR00251 family)